MLKTQQEVESTMYLGGISRAERNMGNAEDNGRAHQNPYAKELFSEYVLPLAAAVDTAIKAKRAGPGHAHLILLTGLDLEAVAFLAVRYTIGTLLSSRPETHRQLSYGIGRTIHRELILAQIHNEAPELYETMARDFGRRMSKSERHRLAVLMRQAKARGLEVIEWSIGSREQVGIYLMGLLEAAGLIQLGIEMRVGKGERLARDVFITPEVTDRINAIKGYVAVTMPVYGPCVEPPLDWGFGKVGGFHTREMQRTNPSLVHGRRMSKTLARNADMPIVYSAVNALQRTAWAVNTRVLNTVYAVAKAFSTKEIVSLADSPKPPPPEWLGESSTPADKLAWPEARLTEFKAWKRQMAEWHTQRKITGVKYARFYAATRAAEMFREYPSIYFVHFADSRGRLYPLTYGLNPQGSDLSKALIHFAEGKPLDTPSAVLWFHVQGANKWGFDKATLEDRAAWVRERHDLIMTFAADPVNNIGWTEAGDPIQFLAWCFEYETYTRYPENFKSHLPISMDGSCNGLQNLSAMFRDEVGGKATNLTNNEVMEDIYNNVAKAAMKRLEKMTCATPELDQMRKQWLAHGVSRSAVKRSVMTTPYGVTRRSAVEYVIDDYLRANLGPTFDPKMYRKAAELLMTAVWPAIGDVVVKGREAMDWLKRAARAILRDSTVESINWVTPSGFPACQDYFVAQVHRINTWLHGPLKIRVHSETDTPDVSRHASGLAPNFVHSLDAAHLHLTTAKAVSLGITSLAMIHDDYGTHAADAQVLYDTIREQFVAMYLACDPPELLRAKYPCIVPPPSKGTLDIMDVLESKYFFS